jgi:beta-glucosidase
MQKALSTEIFFCCARDVAKVLKRKRFHANYLLNAIAIAKSFAIIHRRRRVDKATTPMTSETISVPDGFIWGAATAAYQIEGSWDADGKGESIWDRFAHTPGKVLNGDHGDIACDSYHRYQDDVDLLRELRLKSYRYSVAWPRIQPLGSGAPNAKGLDYYKRLTDSVLEAGIRPMITLYHWDLPQALEDFGGWSNRDTAQRFADYVAIVADALADRVQHWLIFNEPKTFTGVGYWQGRHAPGRKDPLAFLRATHTVNLAQGMSFRALKAQRKDTQVGSAFDVAPMFPATQSYADIAAAERWHRFQNLWFSDPALHGRYPEGVLPVQQQAELLGMREGDGEIMRAPLDFIGLNYYAPWVVHDDPKGNGVPGLNTLGYWAKMLGAHPKTDIGWDIYPQGFYDILARMARETGNRPIEITENGASFNTAPDADGRTRDHSRIEYLRSHLQAMARAIRDGIPVRAFHYWSLLDNFEWAEGYSQRFGIVHVDFANKQKRTIKESGYWYAKVAMTNVIE